MPQAIGHEKPQGFTIHLSSDTVKMLEVLRGDSFVDVEGVLSHLAHSAADGVRRPGAWERSWVEQCFGPVDDRVEQDPDVEWQVRPRGG